MTGVIYACSHRDWLAETIRSAESCRRHMPEIPCIIYITNNVTREMPQQHPFTDVVLLESTAHPHRPRMDAMLHCRYDRALFLDGDTRFTGPTHELFEVLEHFDVGLVAAPQYIHPRAIKMGIYERLPPVSWAIPEWNAGVIVARLTDRFRAFVQNWSEWFSVCEAQGYPMDQAALRTTLATSDLRVATLPANYNFRINMRQIVKGSVKILHGHGDLEIIESQINQETKLRAYEPQPANVYGFLPRSP